jgi:HEAT repeat protein
MSDSGEANFEWVRTSRPMRDLANMVKEFEAQKDTNGLLEIVRGEYPPVTRRAAAKALALVAKAEKIPPILEVLDGEKDRTVRINLINGLGRLGNDDALPFLLGLLKDRDQLIRAEAAAALSRFNSEAAYNELLTGLAQKTAKEDYLLRQYTAEALGKMADRRSLQPLITALKDTNAFVRAAAATALGELGDKRAVEPLTRARHTEGHTTGSDCAECSAIDTALQKLEPVKD